ncbi:hypothetical protein KC363_g6181 [Hortaea werneckii]|uniref:Uncharacterized protein n=1 Tax=Hortaea werneckii TaxID=91943 RepID=A0A3M7EYM9_HORWE|nr:hypothetical protein KC325_g3976 [Hortaea werneckii]KAI6994505.1 hypothetical protein KC359_g4601 [Hortaea werneckii]KAI7086916.1 hypothetical protein KC356_g4624 [Hortaea werneckii]KAI7146411.1 hypothetical protein KC344_g3700 [Hortaea werneckii]KAI7174978.1 hypothetical protein KC360_g3951 [Hortaea werneckii]
MPSVLLVTFCLQLLIHALNTLFPQTITELLWSLYTKLPTPQSSDAQETVRLKKDVVRLHREMSATSAQDDFAKWARLRREHDKAKAKYEEKAKGIQNFRATFDKSISALRWLGTQGLQFLCNAYYSKQPMFYLPQYWVPYPVEWVLSFPRAPIGSISVNIWAIACACVIGLVSEAIRASFTLRQGKVVEGSNRGEPLKMDAKSASAGKKEL